MFIIMSLPDHLVIKDYFLSVVYENHYIVLGKEVDKLEEQQQIIVVTVSATYSFIPGVYNQSKIYVDNSRITIMKNMVAAFKYINFILQLVHNIQYNYLLI